tara:strand:+ start:2228 stop:2449 length:222 start_codon:yes stop_codon:yes gene_type:complete
MKLRDGGATIFFIVAGLYWIVTDLTNEQEPPPNLTDLCYTEVNNDPHAARWIPLSEIKDGRCDFNQEVEDGNL